MRYELPKSYNKRMSGNAFPQSAISHPHQPSSAASDVRPRAYSAPVSESAPPRPAPVRSPEAINRKPISHNSASVPQNAKGAHAMPKNTVSASTYQRLLIELQTRNREHENLKQVSEKLLADLVELQEKYEQAIAPTLQRTPATQLPPQPNFAQPGPPPARQRAMPANRKKISSVLSKLSFVDRLRPSGFGRKAERPAELPQPAVQASALPDVGFLNRLRQDKQRNVANSENDRASSGAPTQTARTSGVAGAIPSTQSPSQLQPQPIPAGDRVGESREPQGAGKSSSSAPTLKLFTPSKPVDSYSENYEYGYDSPYQKARQDRDGQTPLWLWLVAWLLLLPVSAGLGYTLVQWVMSPGAPAESPAEVQPEAE